MTIEMVEVDVYMAVYSEHLKRGLKAGDQDVAVPKTEADAWLRGQYVLLSSEREDESDGDESGATEETCESPGEDDDEHTWADDGGLGDGDAPMDRSESAIGD